MTTIANTSGSTDLFGGPLAASAEATASSALKGKRILVVDDNLINLDIASETLLLAGAAVDAASSGREALTMIAGGAYDLVVLDLSMPEMDGLSVGRAIRASDTNTGVSILLFTACDTAEAKAAVRALNAKGLVPKPVDVDDLLNAAVKHA